MIGSSTTITHGLLVPLCGHEISGWLWGWNNLLTGAAAAGEAAGKWVFSPPSRASLLSTAIGSAAPASSSCSSLLRHYYPILRLRPWRAADICRRFIIPSKATTRCCRRSSSFDRLSNNFGSVDWYVNINSFEKLWGNETITIELHPSPINRRRKVYTYFPAPSTGGGSCINSFNKLWDEQLHPRHINRRKVYTIFIPGTSTGGRCTPSSDPSTGGGSCTPSSHTYPYVQATLTNTGRFLPLCTC